MLRPLRYHVGSIWLISCSSKSSCLVDIWLVNNISFPRLSSHSGHICTAFYNRLGLMLAASNLVGVMFVSCSPLVDILFVYLSNMWLVDMLTLRSAFVIGLVVMSLAIAFIPTIVRYSMVVCFCFQSH